MIVYVKYGGNTLPSLQRFSGHELFQLPSAKGESVNVWKWVCR